MIDSDMLKDHIRNGLNTRMKNPIDETHDYVNELEQDNVRLRGLLREIKEMLGYCPYCWASSKEPCADKCKMGKELADD